MYCMIMIIVISPYLVRIEENTDQKKTLNTDTFYAAMVLVSEKMIDSNEIRTRNHLVRRQTLTYLVEFSDWVFIYELTGCGFESRCCHLNFKISFNFSSNMFLDIQTTIECRFTLKSVREMIIRYSPLKRWPWIVKFGEKGKITKNKWNIEST